MSELRAPDPTIRDHHTAIVHVDTVTNSGSDPCVAHHVRYPKAIPTTRCGLPAPEGRFLRMRTGDAAYVAVPCRDCWPDAPEPGDPQPCDACIAGGPHPRSGLAWQVRP